MYNYVWGCAEILPIVYNADDRLLVLVVPCSNFNRLEMEQKYHWITAILAIALCPLRAPVTESLTWTAEPSNQTEAIRGQHVSLTWRYSLTADELTKSNTFLLISWSKLNLSSSTYDQFANRQKITGQGAAYFEPSAPRIVIDRATGTNFSSLEINNVRLEDEGSYKIEISVEFPGTVIAAHDVVHLTVLVPPEIVFVSTDTNICEGSNVTLSCNATGVPPPSITWTKVGDDGKDGGALPMVDGHYVMNSVSRSANGTYCCTASNPAGTVNRTVQVVIRYLPSVDEIRNSSNTVTEGGSFHIMCVASGGPKNYTWIRIDSGKQVSNEAVLIFNNINRNDSGQYRCETKNRCGNGSMVQSVDVYFVPEIVFVSTDTDICEGSNVTLSCNATGVPPPSITWTRVADDGKDGGALPTVGGSYVMSNVSRRSNGTYRCTAINRAGVVNRTIQLTVRYSASVDKIVNSSNTVNEGSYFNMTCEASGDPEPTNYTWIGVKRGQQYNGKTLSFKNIAQNDAGEYRCEVENRCGKGSESTTVVVYFPPNITDISRNQTVNEGDIVALNCTAGGNPTPTIAWTRISDNSVVTMPFTVSRSSEGGYKCTVYNGIGNPATSYVFIDVLNYRPTDTNLTTNLTNNTVVLNEPFNLMCSADANPPAHYRLYKQQQPLKTITDNQVVGTFTTSVDERIKQLIYNCAPFNSFGVGPSDTAIVTVHYNPANVTLVANSTENENCSDLLRVTLTCVASDANPAVISYQLYGGGKKFNTSKSGQWSTEISQGGEYVYSCLAEHCLGNVTSSKNHSVYFNVPPNISVKVICGNETLKEGGNVSLFCDASGFPLPTVLWSKLGDDGFMNRNAWLNFTNITRDKAGNYACHAKNTCGKDSSSVRTVDVQFSPSVTSSGRNETVPLGTPVTFTCPVDGNPPPSVRWYKGSEQSGTMLSSGKELKFTMTRPTDTGLYTCFACNFLGNISVSFGLEVEKPTSPTTSTSTSPREMTVVKITLTITNKDCNNFPKDEFRVEAEKTLEHLGLKDIEIETRCGSVIVDLALGFNQSVDVNDVISTLKDAASDGKFGDFNVDSNSIRQTSLISTSSPSPTNAGNAPECSCSCNTVLWVTIGILVAIIIVLIIIIVWQHKKGTTTRPYEVPPRDDGFYDNEIAMEDVTPAHVSPSSSTQKLSMSGPGYMDLQEVTRSGKYRTDQSRPTTSQRQNLTQAAEYAPLSLKTRSWEVARDNVTVDKIIGKGAFGQVAKATAIDLPFSNGKTTVAVKMLKPNTPEADKKDLLSELELMKTLKPHPHIIKLMGCVTLSEPLLVLIEYVPYGDLLGYLRKSRGLNDTYYKDPDAKPRTSLTSQQLMKFAWQIADGMSYLSSRKIIHRDLAARNVLVGERETCKVTDFGMARDVQQEDIYEKKTRGRLPVKWTAYESLLYGTYTTKSDVWSYGVVLYEIFTIGGSPYPRMDGKKIANALQHGYRMPKPQHVDDAL